MESQTSPNKVSSFTTWASTTVGIFLPCVNLGLAIIFEIKIIKFNLENKWRRIYLHIGTTDRNRHSKQKNKNKESFERWLTKKHGWAMRSRTIHILQFDFEQIAMSEHQMIGRIDPTYSKTLFWLYEVFVVGLPLFHSWVVASIGDLKLLALFGVLVLKSFFRPTNIPLSLLKLGFTIPSWPEPSLSDDLKEKYAIKLA